MNEFDSSTLQQQQQQHGQGQGRGGGGHICQCLSRISTVRSNRDVTIYYNGKEHHNGSTGIIRRKTGLEFVKSVVSLARGLFELGLRAGDIVAIAALNSDLYLEWLLAISFVGGIAAPLNYRWSFEEARSAMKAVNPVMLVFDESCHTWYTQLQHNRITSVRWYVFIGADLPHYSTSSSSLIISSCTSVLTTENLKKPSEVSPQFDYCWAPDGIALICFTSGTTGRPKGVAITHTALIVQSLAKIAIVGYSDDDVYLHTAPLCHIGGISSGMAMLMTGACHVLIPKFEPNSALKAIEEHHVSSLITVPTMLLDLISFISSRSSSSSRRRISQESSGAGGSMKKILNGGGGLSPQLIRDSALIFPNAKLISAYGMTETCSSLTFMTLYNPALKKSDDEPLRISKSEPIHQGVCVGKPAPHVELRISDEGSSSIGTLGSIITRGPHVMLKYWGQTLVSNHGWIDTGDIGWIDDHGDLWLVGRSKDRIKSGGENVYPEEVESILSQHPGVLSILVIGIPDTRLSEMVVGCVRMKENWQWAEGSSESLPERGELRLSSGILQHYCKQMNLSRFKIPKIFILWSKPFPLTSTGKLRRNEVRIEAICHLQLLPSKL